MFNAGKKFILLLFFLQYILIAVKCYQCVSGNQADCAEIVECPNMEYVSTNRDNFTETF